MFRLQICIMLISTPYAAACPFLLSLILTADSQTRDDAKFPDVAVLFGQCSHEISNQQRYLFSGSLLWQHNPKRLWRLFVLLFIYQFSDTDSQPFTTTRGCSRMTYLLMDSRICYGFEEKGIVPVMMHRFKRREPGSPRALYCGKEFLTSLFADSGTHRNARTSLSLHWS